MSWIALIAWLAALLVTAIVLGFCAYEIIGKSRRLQSDLARLLGLGTDLALLRGEAASAQKRLARTGPR